MLDYGYVFGKTLHEKLKERINGSIFVKVTQDDGLYIRIETIGDLTYKYYLDNIADKIHHGLTTDYVAYEVINDFKRFIFSKYLY